MTRAEAILTVVMQVATQAAMAVVMAMKEVDAGLISDVNTVSWGEAHKDMAD